MGSITIHETVDAPVETVFAYVDDHRNTTKYMQGLSRWKPTGETTHGKGAQFEVAMKAGPTTLGSVVDIVSWTQNKVIGWRSVDGFKQKGEWSFKARGAQTDVTFRMDYELPGGIAGRMLSRAADPVVRSNLQKSARTLKEKTEAAAKSAASRSSKSSATKSTAKSSATKSSATKSSATKSTAKRSPATKTSTSSRSGTSRTAKR